ncbi:MAG: dihydrodipicolinate reductase C-terminal domain-containing protein [Flavonifractor plautii]
MWSGTTAARWTPQRHRPDDRRRGLPRAGDWMSERHSVRQPRDKKEIGISAVRGGTIVGEHEIIFAGHDEIMEIRHTALSREIFAQGAVEAAKFMATVNAPGLYDMSQLVK